MVEAMQGAEEASVFYGVEILSHGTIISLRQQGSKTLVTGYVEADCGPVRCHGLHSLKTPNLVRLPHLDCDENQGRNDCSDADQFCNLSPICWFQNRSLSVFIIILLPFVRVTGSLSRIWQYRGCIRPTTATRSIQYPTCPQAFLPAAKPQVLFLEFGSIVLRFLPKQFALGNKAVIQEATGLELLPKADMLLAVE
jgi:hypothetical protein